LNGFLVVLNDGFWVEYGANSILTPSWAIINANPIKSKHGIIDRVF
jgi:hypothetical protein